jgi:uncharacterized protein (TIGR00251 family)
MSASVMIEVKVITKSGRVEVIPLGGERYKVKLTEAPEKGKANKQLIEVLAEYFNIKKGDIKIISGEHSSTKKILVERG